MSAIIIETRSLLFFNIKAQHTFPRVYLKLASDLRKNCVWNKIILIMDSVREAMFFPTPTPPFFDDCFNFVWFLSIARLHERLCMFETGVEGARPRVSSGHIRLWFLIIARLSKYKKWVKTVCVSVSNYKRPCLTAQKSTKMLLFYLRLVKYCWTELLNFLQMWVYSE